MHILNFLQSAREKASQGTEPAVHVEYRLVCSGTLFPDNLMGDWSMSDVARILLRHPIELLVASRPYDTYPQELALRFAVPSVTEREGQSAFVYTPDHEIASDVAALLTLLCRRLITVGGKVRAQCNDPNVPPLLADYPVPIVTTTKISYWTPRQSPSYRPHPQAFNASDIGHILLTLPQLKVASAVIRAARLYALAMDLIESQWEICYQLFISAVETMAGAALKVWEPDTEEKIASRDRLISYATKTEKLSKEVAERLAVETCKENPWSRKKFTKFLLDNVNREAIASQDDLFIVPEFFCPKEGDIKKALGDVYRQRSGGTHGGSSYPITTGIGPSEYFSPKVFGVIDTQQCPFPPIGWFERVVNSAIYGFLRAQRHGTVPPQS